MKKIIMLSVAVSLSLFAASCRKVRTCTCSSTQSTSAFTDYSDNTLIPDDTQTSTSSMTSTQTAEKMKKRDAGRKMSCLGNVHTDTEIRNGGTGSFAYTLTETKTTTTSCELK